MADLTNENSMSAEEESRLRNRARIFELYRILYEETDENHRLTMPELLEKLAKRGIECKRKAIYDDVKALNLCDCDIGNERGSGAGYCVMSREFELAELKLLADLVASSKCLTNEKTRKLIKKLEKLAGKNDAEKLNRQIFIADRLKSYNEKVFYNIDTIADAISQSRKISFKYFDYNVNMKKEYRDKGQLKTCSPYAMTTNDEQLYLIANYDKYNGISHFRVDKMEKVEILKEPAVKDSSFNLSSYLNSTFSMFSGTAEQVTLLFDNKFVSAAIDRFGINIDPEPFDGEHFKITVKIKTEKPEPFFGWLLGFGTNIKIMDPPELREKYVEFMKKVIEFNSQNI